MSQASGQSPLNDSAQPPQGVLLGEEGTILQRGGEEIKLRKTYDWISLCVASEAIASSLVTQWQPVSTKDITPRPIQSQTPSAQPLGRLYAWQVLPERLEETLEGLRQQENVLYASHVYTAEIAPGSFFYIGNELTVQFEPALSLQQIEAIAFPLGLIRTHSFDDGSQTHCFRIGPMARQNPVKIANHLLRLSAVLLAEPNVIMAIAPQYRPTDSRYPEQWYLYHRGGASLAERSHVFAERAWDITRGSRSVTIAITDDGFDLAHPDLQGAGKVVAPRDLKNRDTLPAPNEAYENHGTAVAGIAVAEETGTGIVGIAPGCSLMPIQTTGYLDDGSIEQLFDWAMRQGADIISCSWSPASVYFPLSRRISRAINRAATEGRNGKGCVVVFSAGNANRPVEGTVEESGWPRNLIRGLTNWLSGFAIHPDVITVSACTSLNRKAAYSNWGRHISVTAPSNNAPPAMALAEGTFDTGPPVKGALPGRGILTSDRTGEAGYSKSDFAGFGGTSSACPLVAGVAGLMLSVNPDLTAQEVKQILQQSADKITDPNPDPQLGKTHGTYDRQGHSLWFGYGKVNAYEAVKAAQVQMMRDRTLSQTLKAQNRTATPIPDDDPRGSFSAVTIAQRGTLQDIKVYIHAQHEFLGDVSFTLIAPDSQKILLQGRTLGRQVRLQRTYSFISTPALRRLLNISVRGRWQLQVIDHSPGSVGQLKQWELTLGI